jgi:nuclear mRNA export protein SAC3
MVNVGVDSCNVSCREEEAKAKRLARFHVELSRPVENTNDYAKALKGPADKPKQATSVGKISFVSNDNTDERMADMDSPELEAIVGLCPDMCPGAFCSESSFLYLI